MNWNVNDIYNYLLWLADKNQSGGIPSEDFFYMWNAEQTAYQEDLLGKWQNRNNGKEGANTGLILNETSLQKLAPFTLSNPITISSGKAIKPDDFIYEVGIRMSATGGTADSKVYKINPGQIPHIKKSVIDPPSITDDKYYATEYENYYALLPSNVTGSLTLDYIASCRDVKWGFTWDADDRQVYSAADSVQSKWSKNTNIEITKRALKSLGVHFNDKDFENFGNSNIVTGD